MNVVIIDYDAGNTKSVEYSLNRLGVSPILSDQTDVIVSADKVVFPGVGNARYAMRELNNRGLVEVVKNLKQDVLGVCLGMQLMCSKTEEGGVEGLGIFDTDVIRFSEDVKVPQIGWNQVMQENSSLMKGIDDKSWFYFVHSYYVPLTKDTVGVTNYGVDYSACLEKANFYGCQFHPEKSSTAGEQLIKNFLEL